MKAINDHEYSKLNQTLDHLNKHTVNKLEKHRLECVQVTRLWNNMTNTTGWCKDAIKPRQKDFSRSLTGLRSQINPWAYCTQGTIEDWEKYPSKHKTLEQQRPKTAHSRLQEDHTNVKEQGDLQSRQGRRPATVSGERRQNKENVTDIEEKLHVAGLQTNKLHVVKPRPFHSPRLNDRHVKVNKSLRPTTAGAKLGGGDHDQEHSAAKVKRRLSSAVYSRYSSVANDSVFEDETDGPVRQTGRTSIKIVIPQADTEASVDEKKERTTSMPKSVIFSGSHSGFSSSSVKPEKPRSTSKSGKGDWFDSSSDEEVDHRGLKKKKENKQDTQKPKIPKFYVKPQDRYKVEDMFLMRRYTLLQRQIASEMPSSVVEDNEKLKIQQTFSAAAKRKLMTQLIEKNNTEIKNSRKTNGPQGLHNRIQRFLRNIDEFIEEQNDQEE